MERQASVRHFAIINSSLVKGQKHMTFNKVEMIGHLVANPTSKTAKTGQTSIRFCIATNWVPKSNSGQDSQKTDFHECIAFGRLGDVVVKYLKKGDRVFIDGRLQSKQWTSKDGAQVRSYEIVVSNLIMLGGGQKRQPKEKTNDDVVVEEIDTDRNGEEYPPLRFFCSRKFPTLM